MRRPGRFLVVLLSALWSGASFSQTSPDVDRKVDSVLALMTLEDKAGQLNQISGQHVALVKRGLVGSIFNVVGAERTGSIQRMAVEETRLHIPILFGLDVIHGFRTVFPIPLAEASSWDPEAVRQSARIAAAEASASGIQWTFAPMVDIARDPRWGRIAEGSGEDPYLGSVMAAARVQGFQGTSLRDPSSLMACAKHFAAYGGAEGGRDYNTVDISERTLREVYLPPFRAAVDAGAGTLMSSFNEIAGIPSSANRVLLTDILRKEWGFRGFVVSDWGAIGELLQHGIAGVPDEAVLKAISAGVDMDMVDSLYIVHIPELVRSGKLPIDVVNESVRCVLRAKFLLGLFDNPYRNARPGLEEKVLLSPDHRKAARRIAGESIVLLKNEGDVLPIGGTVRSIAVIGPLARSRRDPLGPWDAEGRAEDVISILDGISARAAAGTAVVYAPGCDSAFVDTSGFGEAVRAAEHSDVVVLVVGETRAMSGEAASRADIGLPGVQEDLVRRVCAAGKPVVLVLMNGRPLCIPWEAEHVQSVVEAWFLGVESGNAVADVLFGDVNPSGKLPVTFPRSVGQIPLYYNHKNTGRPYSASDRYTSKYLDLPNTPLFPFGYGLSYTLFAFSNLKALTPGVSPHGTVRVSVDVTNTGKRHGEEVVQLYVHDRVSSVTRPVKELKGFRSISLDPGETRTVEFKIESDHLGFYDQKMKYVVEPGMFDVYVGGDSENTLATHFELVK